MCDSENVLPTLTLKSLLCVLVEFNRKLTLQPATIHHSIRYSGSLQGKRNSGYIGKRSTRQNFAKKKKNIPEEMCPHVDVLLL